MKTFKDDMKKLIIMLLLLSVITTPLYALNLFEKIKYVEVRLGNDMVLVNRFTGKVEQRWVDGKYESISSNKGFGGIPSEQDMYQARLDRKMN